MTLHRNVPFAEYLTWPKWSQSTLKRGLDSMAHAKAAFDGTATIKPTDDMLLGSALHCAFLEPELLLERVVCYNQVRRGKAWDAFAEEHADKIILTAGRYESLRGMIRALRQHPFVKEWAGRIEDVEVSATGDVFGLEMKGRCDALTTDPLVDLKASASADPVAVQRQVLNFGYHIQAAIYAELFGRSRFILLVVENQPPHDVVPYELAPAAIRLGRNIAKRLVASVLECEQSGVWPGRSDEIVELSLPDWAVSAEDVGAITIGGERMYTDDDAEFDRIVAETRG